MKTLKQLFLLLFSFLFVLILAELFIKNAKISEVSFAEYYNDIGKGLAQADTFVFFNEGFGIRSTNASRFIGSDVALKKDEKTIRIALVGDSYIESLQVFERHYFGNIAKDILNKKFNQKNIKIEVLNFGRSHFNIGNMYAYQKLLIDEFKPDYTLYFLSENDLTCDYSFPPLLPIITIENGELKTSVNINKEDFNIYQKTKYLTQNFVLFNILNFCRKKIKYNETLPIILGKFYTKSPNVNEGIQNNVEETYKVDSITSEIINSMDSSTIIINRGNYKLPIEFKNLCLENNLTYLELSPTYEFLKKSGIIFDKWSATNKFGHWQHSTHKAIGEKMANIMGDIIQKKLNSH